MYVEENIQYSIPFLIVKVETVLEMVDNTLGILPTGEDNQSRIRNPSESMALLFVSSTKQIVGFLLAEHISNQSNTISNTKPSYKNGQGQTSVNSECVMHELDDESQNKVCVGISRIWVRSDHQRRGIGNQMVNTMRSNFFGDYGVLSPEQFAFSHTTPNGTDFAMKYMKNNFERANFLTYAPIFANGKRSITSNN